MGIGCVLRLSGEAFDVDLFSRASHVLPCASWKKGDRRVRSRPPANDNGCAISISSADDLPQQCKDAIAFLSRNTDWLKDLVTVWKVADPVVDLSSHMPPEIVYAASYHIPVALLRLLAELGIALELSIFRVLEDTMRDLSLTADLRSKP
jgi:hypothetical protein